MNRARVLDAAADAVHRIERAVADHNRTVWETAAARAADPFALAPDDDDGRLVLAREDSVSAYIREARDRMYGGPHRPPLVADDGPRIPFGRA